MSNYPINPGPLPAADLKNKSDGGNGPLGKGDRMEELVKHIQKMLKALGFNLGEFGPNRDGVDGKFGDDVEKTVKKFQEKSKDWEGNQLNSNGSVDERTSDALNRTLVGAWYDFYQTDIELTGGKRIITAERKFLSDKGLGIENLENEKNIVIIIKGLTKQKIEGQKIEPTGASSTVGDTSLNADDPIPLEKLKGIQRTMANIYNNQGKYLEIKAKELGIDVASAAAVLKVESGGVGFGEGGKIIIRFENHVFFKYWGNLFL
jgi:peptidoglycan hydrolase-like protein with peptidoglycan-binding domain